MTFHLSTLHLVLLLYHSYSWLWGSSTALYFTIFDSRLCWTTMYLFFPDSLWTCWPWTNTDVSFSLEKTDCNVLLFVYCLLTSYLCSWEPFHHSVATYCLVTWWLGHLGKRPCQMCILCSPDSWLFRELSHKFLRCDFSLQKLWYVSMNTQYHLHSRTMLFSIIMEFLCVVFLFCFSFFSFLFFFHST